MGRTKGIKNREKKINVQTNEVRMQMLVRCDDCGVEWHPVEREREYIEDKHWIVRGFECPNCHKVYYTTVTDNTIRMNQSKIQDLEALIVKQTKHIQNEIDNYKTRGRDVPSYVFDRENDILKKLQLEQAELKGITINMGRKLKQKYLESK